MAGLLLTAGIAAMILAGCGGGASSPSTGQVQVRQDKARAKVDPKVPETTPSDVIAAFRSSGLEVGASIPMTHADYGPAPLVARAGVRFLVPSLGSGAGGRAFTFANMADLRTLRHYYVALGRGSALLFSWTFTNAKRLVLVQINGDLPDKKATDYRAVVAGL